MASKSKAIFDKVFFNRDYFTFNQHNEKVTVLEGSNLSKTQLEKISTKYKGNVTKIDFKNLNENDLGVILLLSKLSCFGLRDNDYTNHTVFNIQNELEKYYGEDLEESNGILQMQGDSVLHELLQDMSKMIFDEYIDSIEDEYSDYGLHKPNPFAILQLFLIKLSHCQFGKTFVGDHELGILLCDSLPLCDTAEEAKFLLKLYAADLSELSNEFRNIDTVSLQKFLTAIHSFTPKRKSNILNENIGLFGESRDTVQNFVKFLANKLSVVEEKYNIAEGDYITRHTKSDSSLTDSFTISDYREDNNLALLTLLTGEKFTMINKDGETISEFTFKDVNGISWDMSKGLTVQVNSDGYLTIEYPSNACTMKVETKFKDILSKGKFVRRMNGIESLSQYVFEVILWVVDVSRNQTNLNGFLEHTLEDLNDFNKNLNVNRDYASSLTAFNLGVMKYVVDYNEGLQFNKISNDKVEPETIGIRRVYLPYSFKLDNLIISNKSLTDAIPRFKESAKLHKTSNNYVNALIDFMYESMIEMYKNIDSNDLREITGDMKVLASTFNETNAHTPTISTDPLS